ncbi:histidine kinase [Lecanosticta acicola]|uniref:Histidine kinase n=1 Tax=Lecanosticta acicola TaxID=111012 RepID=A0AAI8YS90_9PEZI|nr:histidine kinase [Lecanosticta acicola]
MRDPSPASETGPPTSHQPSPDPLPDILQAHITTVTSLPYPAAVLWGEDHAIFYNAAWEAAGGIPGQGQGHPSRGSLSNDTKTTLRSVYQQGLPKEISTRDLLRTKSSGSTSDQTTTAIASPLRQPDESQVRGILLQLLPKQMPSQSMQIDHVGADAAEDSKIPIDEHPFFRSFAEMLPSGLAILDRDANAVFVNQNFYNLTTLRAEDKQFTSWPQSIHSDDYDRVMSAYQDAFSQQRQLRTEFRAKGEPYPWRLLLLTPLGDENLQHVSLREYGGFICCIVDISSEKSAELAERKAAKQARERKEQQERFIDMISHEIRNPLSAVLHCSEDISEAVQGKDQGRIDVELIQEAVETINLCVTHQKNIVDDVLSFSKLDASLLSLVPKPSQPARQLQNTLRMFQHEFRKQNLDFAFRVDEAYSACNLNWVMADIARISQVLINLITNAIKFTHTVKGERLVHVSVSASNERPDSYPPNIVFFQTDNYNMDATSTQEWGEGEVLYVMVAVKDSGIGISQEGQKRLFERFQQATPKTEEQYGGSGLGLNISRKICQLHGGEIGVSSTEKEGSTFGFFFKVRRSEVPSDFQAENEEEKEGQAQLRGKIQGLGKQRPGDLNSQEPFEWDSHQGEHAALEEARPEDFEKQTTTSMRERPKKDPASAEIPEGIKSQDDQAGEEQKTEDPKEEAPRAHVLLVEDNQINQRIVHRKLTSKGFKVTTANNGQEAVDKVQNAPKHSSGAEGAFDVILMDQEMPVLDGNGATRKIREFEKEEKLDHIPILGVTANVRGAQQDEMLAAGMDDVISKPYKIEDMVAKIISNTREREKS